MTPDRSVTSPYAPTGISENYAMDTARRRASGSGGLWRSCAMRESRSSRARPPCVTLWRLPTDTATRAAVRYLEKVVSRPEIAAIAAQARRDGRRIAFTNGCFDLLHVGHIRYLAAARDAADLLIVGVNDDASVRRLKGPTRPLVPDAARAEVLAALAAVDYVTLFSEDTPYELIRAVQPDLLVKGSDWAPDQIVGADIVRARGGVVRSLRFAKGYSTTRLIHRMRGISR